MKQAAASTLRKAILAGVVLLVKEMGFVEIGAGEFVKLPSGRVVEGSSTADRKVLVGVFGPIEVPYVVQRAGTAWKVASEPYFILLSQ